MFIEKRLSYFKTIIIFGFVSILGILCIPFLPIRLNPTQGLPSLTISYSWPHSSPQSIDRNITTVIEGGMSTLRGLSNIKSKSRKGSGYVFMEFDKYTNIESTRFEVASLIRQIYDKLPKQSTYPIISVNKPEDEFASAFLSYNVAAEDTPYNIQKKVKNYISPLLASIKEIDKIEVFGANPKEYLIRYDDKTLRTLGITKKDVINAIKRTFNNESLGNIIYDSQHMTMSIQGQKDSINWHIPIENNNGKIVFVDNLAKVSHVEQESLSYYRVNGKNIITVNLFAKNTANTLKLATQIRTLLINIEKNLPNDYVILNAYDSTDYLWNELIKILKRTLYAFFFLLLFILITSKSPKYLLVVLISLCFNLVIPFLFYYIFRVEIQLYSLAGITISLGLIIDNVIIIINETKNHNGSAIIPVLASTLTTSGALLAVILIDNELKTSLVDFSKVIIINLGVSLIVAFYLIPTLIEKVNLINRGTNAEGNKSVKFGYYYSIVIERLLSRKKLLVLFMVLLFGIPVFLLPPVLKNNNLWYEKIYNTTLGNQWYLENMRPFVDKYVGGSFRLFNLYVFENAQYGHNKEQKLYVVGSMEKGATAQQLNDVFIQIEHYLKDFKQVSKFKTKVFGGDYARTEITFKMNEKQSNFPLVLKSLLIQKVLDIGGVDWNIYGIGKVFNSENKFNERSKFWVKGWGYNFFELNNWSDSLKNILKKHPRVQNVIVRANSGWAKSTSYEYVFSLDKYKLSLAKSAPSKIMHQLRDVTLSKYPSGFINVNGDHTSLRMEAEEAKEFDVWAIQNTHLKGESNVLELNDFSKIIKQPEQENIYKENQEYVKFIEFIYTGTNKNGIGFLQKTLKEIELGLPLGYRFEKFNENDDFDGQKNTRYLLLFLTLILIIYIICAILFESIKQPIIILSVIPVAFIGVFLTFYLFDFNFDQGGVASFILLSGITVNSLIIIINRFNFLKRNSDESNSNISFFINAVEQNIFPILLTTMSTILTFIPFIISGQLEVFWFALGAGTIGGLLFSIIGIFVYLPIFILWKEKSKGIAETLRNKT